MVLAARHVMLGCRRSSSSGLLLGCWPQQRARSHLKRGVSGGDEDAKLGWARSKPAAGMQATQGTRLLNVQERDDANNICNYASQRN